MPHHHKLFKNRQDRFIAIVVAVILVLVALGYIFKQSSSSKGTNPSGQQDGKVQEIAAVVDITTGTFLVENGKYYITSELGGKTEVIVDKDLTRFVGASGPAAYNGKKVSALISKNQKTGATEVVSLEYSK